jgi:hypothetical protein
MSIFVQLSRTWRNWRSNSASLAELHNLSPHDLANVAREVGASTDELRTLAGKWPDSANLLARRMAALQIDPLALRKSYPAVSRDLQKTCSLCKEKARCEHDLDSGGIPSYWQKYCANSTTLMAILKPKNPRNSSKQ